jgi:hypothetical protein
MTTSPEQLLIIDTTREGQPDWPEDFDTHLQEGVAKALNLPLEVVQAAWTAVCLIETRRIYVPGESSISSLSVIEGELEKVEHFLQQRGQTLLGMQTVLVYDEDQEGVCSVAAGFAISVYTRTNLPPRVLGMQQTGDGSRRWNDVDCIPNPNEAFVGISAR